MATAKTTRDGPGPGGRRWRRLALLAALVLVAAFAWYRSTMSERAVAAAAYAARIGCACRYIGERSLDDCRKDFLPGMKLVRLSEDEAGKTVTGTFPLLARQTATWKEGFGCTLEPWRD